MQIKFEFSPFLVCCCSHKHHSNCEFENRSLDQKCISAHIDHTPCCDCTKRNMQIHNAGCIWAEDFVRDFSDGDSFTLKNRINQKGQILTCCCPQQQQEEHSTTLQIRLISQNNVNGQAMSEFQKCPERLKLGKFTAFQQFQITKELYYFDPQNNFYFIRHVQLQQAFEYLTNSQTYFLQIHGKFGQGKTEFVRQLANFSLNRGHFLDGLASATLRSDGLDDFFNHITNGQTINNISMLQKLEKKNKLYIFDMCDALLSSHAELVIRNLNSLVPFLKRVKIILITDSYFEIKKDQSPELWSDIKLEQLNQRDAARLLIHYAEKYLEIMQRNYKRLEKHALLNDPKFERSPANIVYLFNHLSGKTEPRLTLDQIYQQIQIGQITPSPWIKQQKLKQTKIINKSKLETTEWQSFEYFQDEQFLSLYQPDDIKLLGSGTYGTVFRITPRDYPATDYQAIKIVTPCNEKVQNTLDEIKTLLTIKHDFITNLIKFDKITKQSPISYFNNIKKQQCFINNEVVMFMEYADLGTLTHFVKSQKQACISDITILSNLICDMSQGLQYAHSQGMFHFDLKPDNVLVFSHTPKSQRVTFKISDVGGSILAKFASSTQVINPQEEESKPLTILCSQLDKLPSITQLYLAPELNYLQSCIDDECEKRQSTITQSSDIFSFGLIILQCIGANKTNIMNVNVNQNQIKSALIKNIESLENNILDNNNNNLSLFQLKNFDKPCLDLIKSLIEKCKQCNIQNQSNRFFNQLTVILYLLLQFDPKNRIKLSVMNKYLNSLVTEDELQQKYSPLISVMKICTSDQDGTLLGQNQQILNNKQDSTPNKIDKDNVK